MSSEPKTTTAATSNDEVPFQINQKKLKELAERSEAVKIGGKVGLDLSYPFEYISSVF